MKLVSNRTTTGGDVPPAGRSASEKVADAIAAADASGWEEPWPLGMKTQRPFPVDTLPPLLRSAVDHLVASRAVHPSLPAAAYLASISGALAEWYSVDISITWTETVNLYMLVVAVSGDGKTPAFRPGLDLAAEIETCRCEVVDAEVLEAKAR